MVEDRWALDYCMVVVVDWNRLHIDLANMVTDKMQADIVQADIAQADTDSVVDKDY